MMLSSSSTKLFDIVISWISYASRKLLSWIFPVLAAAFSILLIVLISVILYLGLAYVLLPKIIFNEPIYFNFAMDPPLARINILSDKKQWNDTNEIKRASLMSAKLKEKSRFSLSSTSTSRQSETQNGQSTSSVKSDTIDTLLQSQNNGNDLYRKGFLVPDISYSINIELLLSKSNRNNDLGKFMVFLNLYDTTDDLVAKSSRPISIPYQFDTTIFLESILFFPFMVLGFTDVFGRSLHSIKVYTQMINNYVEPKTILPSTKMIEFSLSTSIVDIQEAHFSIIPTLTGISYYMYYYPWFSFFIGVLLISAILISLAFSMVMFIYLIRIFLSEPIQTSGNLIDVSSRWRYGASDSFSSRNHGSTLSSSSRFFGNDFFGSNRGNNNSLSNRDSSRDISYQTVTYESPDSNQFTNSQYMQYNTSNTNIAQEIDPLDVSSSTLNMIDSISMESLNLDATNTLGVRRRK